MKSISFFALLLFSLTLQPLSAQDAVKANIKKAYDALNRRDFASFTQMCAPDFTEYSAGPSPIHTPQAAVEAYQSYFTAFPDLRFQVNDIAGGENGRYYVSLTLTGTNTGPFGMLPATGKSARVDDVDVLELNPAGLAVSHRSANPGGMMSAVGYGSMLNPNTAVISAMYEAFGKGDLPTILAHCTDNVTFEIHDRSFDSKPRVFTGKDGVGNFFAELGSKFRYAKFLPWRFLADGDDVTVLVSVEFTLLSTGKNYSANYFHHFRLVDGKIASFKGIDDMPVMK